MKIKTLAMLVLALGLSSCSKQAPTKSEKIILSNRSTIEIESIEYKNNHLRFCTKENVEEKSYLVGKVGNVTSAVGPTDTAIHISSPYHQDVPVYVYGGRDIDIRWSGRTVSIPVLRSLEDSCEIQGARMYEIINQNDSINIKDVKIIKERE